MSEDINSRTTSRTKSDNIHSIKIPSWELIESNGNKYAVYVVEICSTLGNRHIVRKRYSEFRTLRRKCRSLTDRSHYIEGFPKKKWFFNTTKSCLDERRKLLEIYINKIALFAQLNGKFKCELCEFIQVEEDLLDYVIDDEVSEGDNSHGNSAEKVLTQDLTEGLPRRGSQPVPFMQPKDGSPPMTLTGYIKKESSFSSALSRYLFELKSTPVASTLRYYAADGDTVKGVLDLRACRVEESEECRLSLETPSNGIWILVLEDSMEYEYWMSAINCHIAYAQARVPPPMKGYLMKAGHINQNSWNKRYFVLQSTVTATTLTYYEHHSEDPPYGVNKKKEINIRDYELDEYTGSDDMIYLKTRVVEAHPVHDVYRLRFIDSSDRAEWVDALRSHIEYVMSYEGPESLISTVTNMGKAAFGGRSDDSGRRKSLFKSTSSTVSDRGHTSEPVSTVRNKRPDFAPVQPSKPILFVPTGDDTPPIRITGYIKKESSFSSALSRYLFELKSTPVASTLTYYAADGDTVKGVLDLRACRVEESEDHRVTLVAPGMGVWVLVFDTQGEFQYWIAALRCHIAYAGVRIPESISGYMKKEGHIRHNWKKRFFVLESTPTSTTLTYYEKHSESSSLYGHKRKKQINLREYELNEHTGEDDMIILKTKIAEQHPIHDVYKLKFLDPADRDIWVPALKAHLDYVMTYEGAGFLSEKLSSRTRMGPGDIAPDHMRTSNKELLQRHSMRVT